MPKPGDKVRAGLRKQAKTIKKHQKKVQRVNKKVTTPLKKAAKKVGKFLSELPVSKIDTTEVERATLNRKIDREERSKGFPAKGKPKRVQVKPKESKKRGKPKSYMRLAPDKKKAAPKKRIASKRAKGKAGAPGPSRPTKTKAHVRKKK